jgi:hypothetical protein
MYPPSIPPGPICSARLAPASGRDAQRACWPGRKSPTSIGNQKRVNVCSGASRAVPAARLSGGCGFQSGPLLPTIRPGKLLDQALSRVQLCAAQHDKGVYRLHALTWRQHHQRVDVQFRQVSFKVHGEVRHAHQVSASAPRSAAGRPRKPWSNRAPLTSAIIACASERVTGQRRRATSL